MMEDKVKLMDMLDNVQAYTEEELRDVLADDAATDETYRTMVTVRQSYRKQHADSQPVDVEAAWEKFCRMEKIRNGGNENRRNGGNGKFRKVAAAIIGVLLISGLSYATIHQIKNRELRGEEQGVENISSPEVGGREGAVPSLQEETETERPVLAEPKTFDNVPLGEVLPEIAGYYGMAVRFQSEESKGLRLFFTWNPQEPVEKVISKLNQFEHLSVTRDGENIIVE